MAPFRHASLPTIHSMGHDGDMDFVVLEHLYGITLADQLRLTRDTETLLPIDDVVRVLRATADALSVIHTAGLCHLDVRPDNIIVTADRRTVLVDCGLCVPELDLGRQAQEVATPAYMAPECRTALDQETARRADLYSLGVTTFELLTGRLPRGVVSRAALAAQRGDPAPSVTQFRDDVPDDLAELVDSMLRVDPAHRPDSAEAIRRQLAGSAPPLSSDRRPRLLIVDDSPFTAKTLARIAEQTLGRVELQVHHDAESALEAMAHWEPDMMLLDLELPGMSGIELCMYLRGASLAPACEIVSVSARASSDDRALLHSLGLRHHLVKDEQLPGGLAALLRSVEERVSRRP